MDINEPVCDGVIVFPTISLALQRTTTELLHEAGVPVINTFLRVSVGCPRWVEFFSGGFLALHHNHPAQFS